MVKRKINIKLLSVLRILHAVASNAAYKILESASSYPEYPITREYIVTYCKRAHSKRLFNGSIIL